MFAILPCRNQLVFVLKQQYEHRMPSIIEHLLTTAEQRELHTGHKYYLAQTPKCTTSSHAQRKLGTKYKTPTRHHIATRHPTVQLRLAAETWVGGGGMKADL
jgi:hypothetical protein